MAWVYAADFAQTTHAGYRRSHVVCETWLLLYTDDKLDIYIYILRLNKVQLHLLLTKFFERINV